MPRRFERHARTSDLHAGTQPSRSAELAAAVDEKPAKPKARKDTRAWCRGKAGREHQPQMVTGEYHWAGTCRAEAGPGWWPSKDGWRCLHRERCAQCGRVMREGWQLGRDCPDYPGSDANGKD